jgi:hypothetical protein
VRGGQRSTINPGYRIQTASSCQQSSLHVQNVILGDSIDDIGGSQKGCFAGHAHHQFFVWTEFHRSAPINLSNRPSKSVNRFSMAATLGSPLGDHSLTRLITSARMKPLTCT